MLKILPPGIWDNPTPEEQQAYQEFVEVWSADDAAFQEYYDDWQAKNSGDVVRSLAYGADCTDQPENEIVCLETNLVALWVLPTGESYSYYDYYNNHHLAIHPVGEVMNTNNGWFSYVSGDGWFRNTDTEVLVGENDFTVFFNSRLAADTNVGTDEWEFGLQADGTSWQLYFSSTNNTTVTSRSFDFTSEAEGGFAAVKTDSKVYMFSYEGKIGQTWSAHSKKDCGSLDSSIDNGTYFDVVCGDGIKNVAIWDRALDDIDIANLVGNYADGEQITNHTFIGDAFCFDYSKYDSEAAHTDFNHIGLEPSGSADVGFAFGETGNGVLKAGGSSDETFVDYITGNGVLKAGGEAFEEHISDEAVYNEVMKNGAKVNGEADQTFFDYVDGEGVVEAGGSADESFFDSEIMDGGVKVGGVAYESAGLCGEFAGVPIPACVGEDLVAFWEFDDTSDKYKDGYTGTHDGTIDSVSGFVAPVQVSSLIDLGMDFTSSEDETAMITVDDHVDLSLGDDLTIAFWFKRDSGDSSFSWTYIQKGENASTEYKIRFDGTDFMLSLGDGQTVYSKSHGTYDWSKWHLVVARKRNLHMSIYLRTEDTISQDCTSYNPWTQVVAGERDLYFGNAGQYGDQFIGVMDEIVMWERCLSDNEVDWLWGDGTAAEGRRMSDYVCTEGSVLLGGEAEESIEGTYNETMDGGVKTGGIAYESVKWHKVHTIDTGTHVAFPTPVRNAQNIRPNSTPDVTSFQTNGLVAWWTGNKSHGSYIYDAFGNDATQNDSTNWDTDPERGNVPAFAVNGSEYATADHIDTGPRITISVWVRLDNDVSNDYRGVLTKSGLHDGSTDMPFSVGLKANHPWAGVTDSGALLEVEASTDCPVGEWVLVTATLDGSLLKLYKNGKFEDSTAVSSPYGNSQKYIFGAFGDNIGDDRFLEGAVDDVRIYNRVLTDNEVEALYNPQTRYDLWFEAEIADLIIISSEPGVLVGGEADEEYIENTEVYNETMDGGVKVNGDAIHDFNDSEIMDGGVKVDGTAEEDHIHNETMDGGVKVDGIAGTTFFDYEIMDGGVKVNGAAEESVEGEYDETMDGGALASGDGSYDYNFTESADGVALVGGSGEEEGTYNEAMDGVALVGGSGEEEGTYNETMDDGALVGGSAEEDFNDSEIMDGGIIIGGVAEESLEGEYNEVMDGGALGGGSADHNAIYNPEANFPVSDIGLVIPSPAHQPNTRPHCQMDVLSPQADGLVAWWAGQDYSQNILDRTHRGTDLTPENGASTVLDDERGWVFNFDGTNQQFERNEFDPAAEKSIPFTHSAWFRTDSSDWDGTHARMIFISRSEQHPTSNSYTWLQFGTSGDLEYGCRTGNNIAIAQDLTNSWDDGKWHLATGVSYSLSDHQLFVDGIQVATSSTDTTQSPTAAQIIRIGDDDSYIAEFPGQIDDVRIYDRALSEEQIQHLWNPQNRFSLWLVPERNTVILGGGIDVVVGGAADESVDQANTYNETMDGGVVVSGLAEESVEGSYDEIMDGGVLVDGTTEPTVIYNPDQDGGAIVNGSGEEDFNDSEIMDGGVVVSGLAEESVEGSYDETMDGGVLANGSSSNEHTTNSTMDGGVVIGGEAEESAEGTYNETMDGGAIVSGDGHAGGVITEEVIDGNFVAGGGEDYFAIFNPDLGPYEWIFPAVYDQVSEQELIDNGNPPPHDNRIECYIQLDPVNNIILWHFTHDYTGLDTIRFRGPAEPGERGGTKFRLESYQSLDSPVIGQKEITAAEVQDIINGLWYVFAREFEEVRDVMRGQIVPYQPTVVGGEADVADTPTLEFGGVQVGGATASVEYLEAIGGVVIGGKALVEEDGEYYEVGEGGAVVAGSALWQQDGHYFEIPEGGAVIEGEAFVDHWENTCRCIPTTRVLSLNELNFLDQQIFIQEMINKTQQGGIVWDSVRVLVQFRSGDGPFEYRMTQTQFGITLDVLKDGKFFGSFSSDIHPKIKELFDDIVILTKGDRRMKDTLTTVKNMADCRLL